MKNLLQEIVAKSFETSSKRIDSWTDPDGVVHDERVQVIEPYTKDMEDLAGKMGLSKSQLYRKLANPTQKWKLSELEHLHEQIFNKDRGFDGKVLVSIDKTKEIITQVRQYDMQEEQRVLGRYGQGAASFNEMLLQLRQEITNSMNETFAKERQQQTEMIQRLIEMNQMKTDLVDQLLKEMRKDRDQLQRIQEQLAHLEQRVA